MYVYILSEIKLYYIIIIITHELADNAVITENALSRVPQERTWWWTCECQRSDGTTDAGCVCVTCNRAGAYAVQHLQCSTLSISPYTPKHEVSSMQMT